LIEGKEQTGGFNRRMCGLNRNLRSREIAADEDVQVRNLGERSGHEFVPTV
jgi:hypothetical protein